MIHKRRDGHPAAERWAEIEEMAKNRGHSHVRTSLAAKLLQRNASPYSITLYTILLFALSIFIFVFYSKDILEDEQKKHLFPENESQRLPDEKLWGAPYSHGLHPCVKPTAKYKASQGLDRYMTVKSNGGLNQMRAGITDMVAVAHVMNATLVIPQLDKRSFWQDSSTFSDVFDEVHFISSLQGDVRIVKELPKKLESVPHARKHFTSWSGMSYYEEMIHLWNEFQKLVERLRFQGGRYIALHLRYEKDMLSFTGCTTGLTDAESEELRIMRENTNHWKMKKINSTEQRNAGLCPLTPKEVGIFLQALSYPPSTLIYIAAGEIYGGNIHLSELKDRFPNVILKEMIATQEELRAFVNHASQTAALDYIVSVESDVFIPSYSGNMARSVEGHRRFLGHRKTITPDREGLVELFDKLETGQLKEGTTLSDLVMQLHKNRQGSPRKRGGPLPGLKGRARLRTEESFYQNPYPECICGPKSGLQ
ncbi:O-fucosyltransferase 38 isoform X4 [Diospyros lotus]|uniref:O-fucosyltransferase 38 isoform X4 n=1 Tax=Diospyros lotus TaxID=55363 RepID=UPI00225992C5|nr:O-fucosyltransferase 38 isoform X4 [Diospyros lotus]